MYVHPDKNPNEKDKAQIAFEGILFCCVSAYSTWIISINIVSMLKAVNRAYKLLDNESERKKCIEVVEEAKERVDQMVFYVV